VIPLQHGEQIRFGPAGDDGLATYAVVQDGFRLRVAKADEVDPGKDGSGQIVVHDAADHELAFALSRLSDQDLTHTVTGIFRDVSRSTYDDAARAQVQQAVDSAQARGGADLQALLRGRDTWTVAG
jgi:2-oxoglutarate ferredoxin oxidoreductase subunit beta